MRLVLGLILGLISIPTAAYVGGRILLPEMGLSAPDWWTWFWTVVIGGLVYLGIRVLSWWALD